MNQTFSSWFLIIVDDGSTDNTKEILLNYKKKKKLLIISNNTNLGINKSLNKAIKNIKTHFSQDKMLMIFHQKIDWHIYILFYKIIKIMILSVQKLPA